MINSNKQDGFTLVELAIVMIIIGLLIGGILKGQELVANSRVTATIAQIQGLQGAMVTFKDKYSDLPGDISNPNVRLRDCIAPPCSTPGNDDGIIEIGAQAGTVPLIIQERVTAFSHLAAADLISGVDQNGVMEFGSALPQAAIGGGFWVGFNPDTTMSSFRAPRGHYLILSQSFASVDSDNVGGITAMQAAQIDRKLDDGLALTGNVGSVGNNCNAGDQYNENLPDASCGMMIRVQI